MAKYRKKPVVIEAVRWTGENTDEMDAFTGEQFGYQAPSLDVLQVAIQTREGLMLGDPGDWIIKGVAGEFYPCKPDIFATSYEPA